MPVVDIYCCLFGKLRTDIEHPEEQGVVCRAYCAAHDLPIGMVHQEQWAHDYYREREQPHLLRTRYRSGQIQGVVVADLNCLSKVLEHQVILTSEMTTHQVSLHMVHPTLTDKFIQWILDVMNGVEPAEGRVP